MSQLFFTKAAALRVLQAQGIVARCVEAIRVYQGSIQVTYRTKNGRCSTFLSKTAFYQDFIAFRQEGAKTCTVRRWGAGSYTNHYECHSSQSEKIYTVKLIAGMAWCECPDYQEQHRQLGSAKIGCKHIISTLNHVGYGSLADYIDTMAARARADLFGDEPASSSESRPSEIATLEQAAITPHRRKTKPAPDPFGGF
jgi:hypothetical protein